MDKPTDQQFAASVRNELGRDARVEGCLGGVEIAVRDGRLRLGGVVEELPAKRIAANVARQLAGEEFEVVDRLRLAAPRLKAPMLARQVIDNLVREETFSDYVIVLHQEWRVRIVQQPMGAAFGIEVRAQRGVVSLAGKAGCENARRVAEVLAWWVPGCSRVDNHLAVDGPDGESDELLTEAVYGILVRDPLVDARTIEVSAAAGIVELRGRTPDDESHRRAVRDVWAVPGVWDVYDRLSNDA